MTRRRLTTCATRELESASSQERAGLPGARDGRPRSHSRVVPRTSAVCRPNHPPRRVLEGSSASARQGAGDCVPRWRSSAPRRGGLVLRPTFRSPQTAVSLGDHLALHTHVAGFGPLNLGPASGDKRVSGVPPAPASPVAYAPAGRSRRLHRCRLGVAWRAERTADASRRGGPSRRRLAGVRQERWGRSSVRGG